MGGIRGCGRSPVIVDGDHHDGADNEDNNLHRPTGGKFMTALNTAIIIKVWEHVLQDGRPFRYDWTVKVDPDTVFLAQRLRDVVGSFGLHEHLEAKNGAYFSNCQFGLHGAVEVFSRKALDIYATGNARC